MERRTFLKLGAGVAAGVPLLAMGGEAFAPGGLRILFLTDIHAMHERNAPAKMREMAARLADVEADIVIAGGDFVDAGYVSTAAQMAPKFALAREFFDKLNRPVEAMLGNHDFVGVKPADGSPPEPDPLRSFRELFSLTTTHRTVDCRGCRFFILDSVQFEPDSANYRGRVPAEQLAWLAQELERTPADMPIVVCSHIPFRTTFMQFKESPTASLPPALVVENANDVLTLFKNHTLVAVLQGHLHVNELIRWNGCAFLTGGAVCGAWWKGDNWGTWPGYGKASISERRCDWNYITPQV